MTVTQALNVKSLTEEDFRKIERDSGYTVVHRTDHSVKVSKEIMDRYSSIYCDKYCYKCDNQFEGLAKNVDWTYPLVAAGIGICQLLMLGLGLQ